jgi:hypothetical protein
MDEEIKESAETPVEPETPEAQPEVPVEPAQ